MKKYYYVIFAFSLLVLILYSHKVEATLPLNNKVIVIDPGHGGKDGGSSYGNVIEKDINLHISLYLEEYLKSYGAKVLLTRDGDYDLSSPQESRRKKSDFDNRIKLINNNGDLYLSIHLNYLSDSRYYGPQVFYNNDNETLALKIQTSLNSYTKTNRSIKKIPKDTYMYNKLKVNGVLIECGFLSNSKERNLLKNVDYQKLIAKAISLGVLEYY